MIVFHPSAGPTLGVEWELALVDHETLDLVPRADDVMPALEAKHISARFHRELLSNTVEIVTGVCRDVPEITADLSRSLEALREVTDPLGLDLLCAGTHPFAQWQTQEVSEGERYATLIDRTRWWGRQMVIYGVHVHVGVTDVARVLPILDGLLPFAPHLQALSASSPFWVGEETGYASNRAQMFQQLPTAGLPFQFSTWAEYERYVDDLLVTGVIDELKEIRWDIRPAPHLGTLEVRVCDGVPTLRELAAITALVQCLVVWLDDRLTDGGTLRTLPPWHVQENKWRAARYGMDAIIICDDRNRERLVTEDLMDLLERLTPVARRLGCEQELSDVALIVRHGASYQRQLAVAQQEGTLVSVARSLVDEMRAGAPAAWAGEGRPA
ncbi:glutamate--cysteine ligase [Janibacter sp. YIM B02568]|uniref:glutamate--cysteine ligase n=1 Tax=Janibacter endophyticus TaxID=2806261 RepID=UPI00194DB069|nr:glutamate--cysteine ligase [Janibacter endophyticus]MBM6545601.1 glutamate--cysteine ligase [Janibacter endophyticus]